MRVRDREKENKRERQRGRERLKVRVRERERDIEVEKQDASVDISGGNYCQVGHHISLLKAFAVCKTIKLFLLI